jgi:hypothetical protein
MLRIRGRGATIRGSNRSARGRRVQLARLQHDEGWRGGIGATIGGQRSLETRLDPRIFPRISRSVIVNVDCIRELRPLFRGDYQVVLRDGAQLHLSHRYRANLNRNALGAL